MITKGTWILYRGDIFAEADGGSQFVATVFPDSHDNTAREVAANAALITHSPQLLDACEKFLAAGGDRQRHKEAVDFAVGIIEQIKATKWEL